MKQTIDLMRPRYKVIADYPESIHEVGDILSGASYEKHALYKDKYPHLFKKLEWWEERPESEMPEYLRINEKVYKIKYWEEYFGLLPNEDNPDPLSDFKVKHHFNKGVPATEAEYQNYLKSKS